ncbi:MAG TPA: MOSC N-terminal beta barrel domain-containing protein [Ilumatobacteraceae bacterium]|nr:MOSC N-terminal beta barrel domain-containing protein [Ilumatobacteraceae bacterium]
MRVLELWRYPVKSLQGERLEQVAVTTAGLEGDRRFALFDVATGFGLTARRVPELLFGAARLGGDGGVDITLPDGSVTRDDDALSAWLGRRVTLRSVDDEARPCYESPVDFEDESTSAWARFEGPSGAFHDSGSARVSLVSTATLGTWDRRRFRANVLLDGEGEDAVVGSTMALGDAMLDVGMRIGRCVMTTRPQAGGIERDLDVLRTINRERDGCLSVGALVAKPGIVRVGDTLTPV